MIKKGNIVKATVTGIEKYGIFVKVGKDYDGLIHISEISDKYVGNINKYAKTGDIIKAEVLDVYDNKKQLSLSIKNIRKRCDDLEEKGKGFEKLKESIDTWIDDYDKI